MFTDELVDRWTVRLRDEVPDSVAIFVGGSHLRGDAGPDSDVDFDVVVANGPRDEWPAWFDVKGSRLVRISAWVRDVDAWLATEREPQDWAFYLAAADSMRLCWAADDDWRERLDRTQMIHPPGPPEIDHFEGDVGKVTNAFRAGDDVGLRLASQDLARSIASMLQPLNAHPPVASRREALRVLLDFDVVPSGYRADMLACLGLVDAVGASEVHVAACRLAAGTMDIVQTNVSVLAPLVPADAAASIRDGSLRRYINQIIDRAV
jgi:predicted nucleotidyltransferase